MNTLIELSMSSLKQLRIEGMAEQRSTEAKEISKRHIFNLGTSTNMRLSWHLTSPVTSRQFGLLAIRMPSFMKWPNHLGEWPWLLWLGDPFHQAKLHPSLQFPNFGFYLEKHAAHCSNIIHLCQHPRPQLCLNSQWYTADRVHQRH